MPKGPSTHLTWEELACKDGTPYPTKFIVEGRAAQLSMMFEDIRSLYDKPITILSAYRTPAWNKHVGGARNSQHVEGRALDLRPPKGVKLQKFYNDIRANVKEFGIHGIGLYPTFVHVDIRPTKTLAVWSGNGVKDSRTNG